MVGLAGRAMTMVRDGDVHRVPAVVDVCRADRPGRRGPDDDDDDIDKGDCRCPLPPLLPLRRDSKTTRPLGGPGRRPSLRPRPHPHRLPVPRPSVRLSERECVERPKQQSVGKSVGRSKQGPERWAGMGNVDPLFLHFLFFFGGEEVGVALLSSEV